MAIHSNPLCKLSFTLQHNARCDCKMTALPLTSATSCFMLSTCDVTVMRRWICDLWRAWAEAVKASSCAGSNTSTGAGCFLLTWSQQWTVTQGNITHARKYNSPKEKLPMQGKITHTRIMLLVKGNITHARKNPLTVWVSWVNYNSDQSTHRCLGLL